VRYWVYEEDSVRIARNAYMIDCSWANEKYMVGYAITLSFLPRFYVPIFGFTPRAVRGVNI